MRHKERIRSKKHAKACAFYLDSPLIKSFLKERKGEKENIPLLLSYVNVDKNSVVVNVQYKGFTVILHGCPFPLSPIPLKIMFSDIYRIRDQE